MSSGSFSSAILPDIQPADVQQVVDDVAQVMILAADDAEAAFSAGCT